MLRYGVMTTSVRYYYCTSPADKFLCFVAAVQKMVDGAGFWMCLFWVKPSQHLNNLTFHYVWPRTTLKPKTHPDMEKSADAQTLSAEKNKDCGNVMPPTLNLLKFAVRL